MEKIPAEDELDAQLQEFKLNVTSDDILKMLETAANTTKTSSSTLGKNSISSSHVEDSGDDDSDDTPLKHTRSKGAKEEANVATTRGRGRGRGGARGARGGAVATPSKNSTRTGNTASRQKAQIEISPSTVVKI